MTTQPVQRARTQGREHRVALEHEIAGADRRQHPPATRPDGLARVGTRARARLQTAESGRLRAIVLMGGMYALSAADLSTVGAAAPQLKAALHVSNTQLGMMAGVTTISGAVATLPAGVLTDRVCRVKLAMAAVVLWSAAIVASALAPSFPVLVLTRIGLGAVTAVCGPTVASLCGDFFPARERGRMMGLILTGDLVGAGMGLVISGDLASATSWRVGFAWLALPGVALAVALGRLLVEPPRGGHSRPAPDEGALEHEHAAGVTEPEPRGRAPVEPDPKLAHGQMPERMSLLAAIPYVLRVRTNVLLIVSSAVAYLFLAGVRTFAVMLMRSRYDLAQPAATSLLVLIGVGGLVGLVIAGQIADGWTRRGRTNARVLTGAIAYMVAAVMFVPGLLSSQLVVALPLLFAGAAALVAPDAALGAARLDVMHPYLWGRAEGVRSILQCVSAGFSPLLFGIVADAVGGHGASHAATAGGAPSAAEGHALAVTFLIMLVALSAAGIILLRAARSYPRDVAAAASVKATGR
jgi:predicted MFS family arabinose efflux permease